MKRANLIGLIIIFLLILILLMSLIQQFTKPAATDETAAFIQPMTVDISSLDSPTLTLAARSWPGG